jgi:two-component system, LytTR family, response regulator
MKIHDPRRATSGELVPKSHPENPEREGSPPVSRTLGHLEEEELSNLPAETEEHTLRPDDFVFLSGKEKCWLIRTGDIWLLEACGGRTRIVMPEGVVIVRRTLGECERRLDSATFFRATRDCIINLTHVKHTRLLDCSRVAFVLPNDKQIIVTGEQNAIFRKLRAL